MVASLTDKPMELEGNLKAFQLCDILRFLAMGKMSGVLTFLDRGRSIELIIKEGALIGTCAGERYPKLGQMLVYNGLITRKQLDEMLDSQQEGGTSSKMLGELLIEKGLVTPEQVESALKLQIREQVWELFSWSDGTFKFEHGLKPWMQRPLATLEIEPLIEEGFQQLEKWREIQGHLGDLDQVFRVSPELRGLPEGRLKPDEWRVLALINGRHTVRLLMYLSGLGRFETQCALDRLLTMQLIEPVMGRGRVGGPARPAESPGGAAAGSARTLPSDVNTDVDEDWDESGLRGLFGKRRRAQRREPQAEVIEDRKPPARVGPFETAAGLGCSLVSRLAWRLCGEADFHETSAAALLETHWRELGMRNPRSDLIVLREGRLDASAFERYARLSGGVGGCMAGCHEDSMESLAQIGGRLAALAVERLGERGRKLVAETAKAYLDCTEVKFPPDFSARQWMEKWGE